MNARHKKIHDWIEVAEGDLKVAKHILLMGELCPFFAVCFHCQQSAEKFIKALLIARDIDFPKLHDLSELIGLLPTSDQNKFNLGDAADLSAYAVDSRYPGEEPEDEVDANRAISIASSIKTVVLNELQKEKIL